MNCARPTTGLLRATPCCGRVRAQVRVMANSSADDSMDISKVSPLGKRILVKPINKAAKSAGGVLLTNAATESREDAQFGEVLSVGSECELSVAKGDSVIFTNQGTADAPGPDGEKLVFVYEDSVLASMS